MSLESTITLRPRYEGANVGTWIGFKHLNYLVEEAVLEHLRRSGAAPAELYHEYGLCVDLVDLDTRIPHALRVDDVVDAEVTPKGDDLSFAVSLRVGAGGPRAVSSKVSVRLRRDARGAKVVETPESLAPFVVDRLGQGGAPAVAVGGADPVEVLGRDGGFVWHRTIPYFYCHFTERLQMSGYLRLMEEVVDRFLADREVSIKTLLDERNWIPAVPHSRITLLDEACMEEEIYTVYTVERVFKRLTYTSRMDTYVLRDGHLVPTATGRITHGYAELSGRAEWALTSFDDRLHNALSGVPNPGGPS